MTDIGSYVVKNVFENDSSIIMYIAYSILSRYLR